MPNEALFILSVLIEVIVILFAARRGSGWLLGTIIVNLILVGIFGAKLIEMFGLVTNAGNIFYACVFLATHFLLERDGKRAGTTAIWYGIALLLFFITLSQLTVLFAGESVTDEASAAITTLFSFSLRVTVASLIAYGFAQYVNVVVYEWLKKRTRGKHLWLRSNGANIVSQLVDSMLFFTIAFFDLPGPLLLQTILVGWLVKTVVVGIGTPFLYADAALERRKV